jgi:phosphoribosylformimino-5-aminoimidazole carboxamide ribonucleotide (ProFAR) isomerase
LAYISILPQVLLVDIDGASDKEANNKSLIESLSLNSEVNLYAVGGGIRSVDAANNYLSYFQHIVISSNLDIIK